jgi:hypothetical protein
LYWNTLTKPKSTLNVKVIAGLLAIVGLILWQFADGFRGMPCIIIHWLSLSFCTASVLELLYSKQNGRGKLFLMVGYGIVVVLLFPASQWVWKPAEKPHFIVCLNTSDFPDANLSLTNKFFDIPLLESNRFEMTNVTGFVGVPVNPETSNAVLKFKVFNDSKTYVEGFDVLLAIPKAFDCSYAEGWNAQVAPDKQYAGLSFEVAHLMYPGDSANLPDLVFKFDPSDPIGVIQMTIRSKGMTPMPIGFWLGTPRLPKKTMPIIRQIPLGGVSHEHPVIIEWPDMR